MFSKVRGSGTVPTQNCDTVREQLWIKDSGDHSWERGSSRPTTLSGSFLSALLTIWDSGFNITDSRFSFYRHHRFPHPLSKTNLFRAVLSSFFTFFLYLRCSGKCLV